MPNAIDSVRRTSARETSFDCQSGKYAPKCALTLPVFAGLIASYDRWVADAH